MNSRFFLPSMDSIFDLIFESASAQSSCQCEDSASKKSTAVQITSVIDLSPSGKRGSLQPLAKAKQYWCMPEYLGVQMLGESSHPSD